ncbi:adenomatous polyposis coli protein 2-like [Anguilla rostrata]|uniref:adenomatous polyposis coli protein 2-like n=1 Tax=Anguilla rostrata TaxID=7938 RepID=UPI0030D4DCD2
MMSRSGASYDQLAQQVEDLRKENSYLRRELDDNSTHLSKLENETSHMKEGLKQLQTKLEQEARSLASTERSDTLDQLRELHMDLTHYYELKYQPHNLRAGPEAPPPRPTPHGGPSLSGEGVAMHPGAPHLLDDMLLKEEPLGETQVTTQHLEELLKERALLLKEIEREEKERCWYYTQLQALSRRLAELPRIDTFSAQIDLIGQQLEFEVQQVRSAMEERFGTSDEMVQRTQIRVARLEQLEKKLQEVHDPPSESQTNSYGKTEAESMSLSSGAEAAGESGSKVEMVFWLLSMLANRDREEMSRTFLAMSSSQESCLAMRKSGCVPLLVQILHDGPGVAGGGAGGGASSREARSRAGAALHNVVYSQPDEGQARREMRVLHVLEQIRTHCETGWDWIQTHLGTTSPGSAKTTAIPEAPEPQICQAMCAIMKLSFEEEYRRAMNELGGLQAVAELVHLDQVLYGMQCEPLSMALRRYAGMTLTNLTFGDVANKATLCSRKSALQAIVTQLESDSEELHQVVSSILRNLSWRADLNSKKALRDVGSVTALMTCALQATKESTLKSLLSALWNLSAHSPENKEALCSVEGSLGFLVSTLTYRCQTNQLAVMESGGGILRNVSSLVATREDYRQVLRDHNCLQILLQHLRSHSLTIVSNACGTLWNLSARSPEDQELLWDLGAVAMLRSLIHSKHKMIAMGSAAALRNLLASRPLKYKDAAVVSPGSCTPSLYMRKQKALEAELDARRLEETFDSMERRSQKVPAPALAKPLRRMESLARDYGSDSGCCFEEDEAAPSASVGLDTTSFSMLSAFLSNNAGGNPPNVPLPQQGHLQSDHQRAPPPDRDTPAVAEGLTRRAPRMAAKPRTAKDDITAPTSSEDSFSLSSEDHLADGRFRADDPRDTLYEARAKSCSPCRLWEGNGGFTQPRFAGAQALLRLKQAQSSLSTDSLNSSGSTSDGYGGGGGNKNTDQLRPAARRSVSASGRKRPDRLDLKEALYGRPEKEGRRVVPPERDVRCFVPPEKDTGCIAPEKQVHCITSKTSQIKAPEGDSEDSREAPTPVANEGKRAELPQIPPSTKHAAGAYTPPIKLSPSYQHVPLIQSVAKFGVAKTTIDVQAAQGMRRQAWVPTVLTGGALTSKLSPASCSAWSPALGQETLQRYSVENTPICFSRCSSLSSLSSADGGLEGRSQSQLENELDSDASLEIIEVEEGNLVKREEAEEDEEDENTLDDLSESQPLEEDTVTKLPPVPTSQPVEIPRPTRREKIFIRQEDQTPSSPSENCVQDSPLVLSRCSSVSSLGSFESPSFASSVQSDPGSEQISGTISPSDLPDSPGQTMPPSRCKTPCCPADPGGQETQAQMGGMGMGYGVGVGSQWEAGAWRRFAEIADFRERYNLPPDLDTMIYFTVERPTENFSCASSLSALPLHEHYIQKDVELKLTPLLHQRGGGDNDNNLGGGAWDEQGGERPSVLDMEKYSEGNSDDDIEILKECISSAMPSRFKTRSSLLANLPRPVFGAQSHRSTTQLPLYMLLPTQATQRQPPMPGKLERGGSYHDSSYHDDSSYSDSPMNISSTTSQSDETLRYAAKEPGVDPDVRRIEELRAFSRFHKPARAAGQPPVAPDQTNRTFRRVGPVQRAAVAASQVRGGVRLQSHLLPPRQEQTRGRAGPLLGLPVIKKNVPGCGDQKGARRELTQRSFHFQSRRLQAAPGHELVCCSCGDLTKVQEEEEEPVANQERTLHAKMGGRNETAQRQINISQGVNRAFPAKGKHAMIANANLSRQPLSSSLRSLSFSSLEEGQGKTWVRNRRHATPSYAHEAVRLPGGRGQFERGRERDSSPSSVSLDSEDDLLQKCITSGMPAQRKRLAAARKKKVEKRQRAKTEHEAAHNAFGSWDSDRDPGSEGDTASDSDLNSVEWRAIQEGARSVVMHLQAVSQSQEPSSETESESGLSLMSDVSSLHSRPGAKKKGGKDNRGNGKMPEGRNAGKPLDFSQRKPVPNMPVVFRGRTVIYTPKKEPISQRPPPTRVSTAKNPSLAQHRSKSLHRLAQPGEEQPEFFLPKRSSTPPARIPKSSSSGSTSSQSSTPLKRPQKKSSAPWPAEKPVQKTGGVKAAVSSPGKGRKEATSPPAAQRAATPRPPEPKKTHKSPVRIPFMQTLPKPPSRTISPLVTSEPSNKVGQQRSPAVRGRQPVPAGSRLNPPTRSGRPPAHNSDRSGFLRQLTFIKESPPRVSRREAMGAGGSRSVPTSQCASPRRARPVAPAVFLCSSRCQELKSTVQKQQPRVQERGQNRGQGAALGQRQRLLGQSPSINRANSGSDRDLSAGRPARRAGSESPCRAPQKNGVVSSAIGSGRPRDSEAFKRYSSSPAINALNRTTSRSSMRSSSSDSSGRAKSEAGGVGRTGGVAKGGVTWRRIRDEDVPHILRSTLPSNALPLVPSPDGKNPPMPPPPPRRTSDATVQTEDFSSRISSSTSPTLEGSPSAKGPQRASRDSPTPPSLTTEGHSGGVGHFRQSCPSKAVRVTPFNYTPSPAPCGPRHTSTQPPKISEAQEEELQAQ